jgi:GNAT superfamily N-acetyltransferase
LIQANVFTRDEGRVHEANTVARIDLIVVKQAHRRHGIGQALLARVRVRAEAKAANGIMLDNYAFNMVAARLYEKAGFDVLKKTYVQYFR